MLMSECVAAALVGLNANSMATAGTANAWSSMDEKLVVMLLEIISTVVACSWNIPHLMII